MFLSIHIGRVASNHGVTALGNGIKDDLLKFCVAHGRINFGLAAEQTAYILCFVQFTVKAAYSNLFGMENFPALCNGPYNISDLNKTVAKIDEAAEALKQIAKSGKKVLFVATKKQAKQVVADKAASVNMPYVIERWPGGMLTNFPTIRKAVKKMATIDKLTNDGTYSNLSKREILQISRHRLPE